MILHLACPRRTGTAILLLGFVLTASLSACGGAAGSVDDSVVSLASPASGQGASPSPGAPADPEEAMLAFSKCMKEHGVDVQVGMATVGGTEVVGGGLDAGTEVQPVQPGTGALDPEAMAEANEACRGLLPAGGMLGDPNATMDPAFADQLLEFAQCMRDQGIDFPDPQFSGGGVMIQVGGGESGGVDPGSKAFQDAQAACAKELPGGAPFVGGGTSPGVGGGPAVEVAP